MYESLVKLQRLISPLGQLEVTHNAYSWVATFEWHLPATHTAISQVLDKLGKPLPIDYIKFIEQISNGGLLFYNSENGQYGFNIFSIDDLISKQEKWKRNLSNKWNDQFIVFSELYGEEDILIFDLNAPSKDLQSYAILEANPYDNYEEYPRVSRSFHEWLDHLITAQGTKYWEWF